MKKIIISFTALCLLTIHSYGYDFKYGYFDVYSSNAMQYVVGQTNIQISSESGNPPSGVCYWNPINNGQEADLTYRFTFAQPTTSIFLTAGIASYNFGGAEFGSGSLWASTNGDNWVMLLDAPTPSIIGLGYDFSTNLPSALTGASEIWIQARLNSSGWNIMAQFCRQDVAANNGTGYNSGKNIFELDANFAPKLSIEVAALSVSWLALSNTTYQVQWSTNLTTWSNLNNVVGAGTITNIIDWNYSGQRFYRVIVQ